MLPGWESKRSELTHPRLVVTRLLGMRPAERKLYQVAGMGTDTKFTVHTQSITNVERGVLERVFYVKGKDGVFAPPPAPLEKAYSRLNKIRDIIVSHLPSTTKMSREEFASTYSGRRKTIYTNAARDLETRPIEVADSHIKVFGKAEKTNITAKPDPVMRIVSPRDPRFNVEVGRYLKPLEHGVYKAIKQLFGEITVAKGLNAMEVGALIQDKFGRHPQCVAIGLDASRFDQHVSLQALRWEHSIYNRHFNDPELAKLLSWQLKKDRKSVV